MKKKASHHLVIVESPTKAKTISKFLGDEFVVESSFGHVRDLPKNEIGIDVAGSFEPRYVIPRAKQKRVTLLKKMARKAEDIYFATDGDREGEAISWHLEQILGVPEEKVKRITFHEVTKEAIHEALAHPQKINAHLVDAQQTRRILDRLVGYELSPFLWHKVAKGLSAGRVQSVAVRLLVEREREVRAFVPTVYWTVDLELLKKDDPSLPLKVHLIERNGVLLEKFGISSQEDAESLVASLRGCAYRVSNVQHKSMKRVPAPPFTTSTLQQDANRKLRFSAKQTMMIAQQLYEGVESEQGSEGYITYMRTDSVTLSEKFIESAHQYLSGAFGAEYAPAPRRYATKSKLAQEAHEAIRPTSLERTPERVKKYLSESQYRLYELIWCRTAASQMADAKSEATAVDAIPESKELKESFLFRGSGHVILFDGFLKVYKTESADILLPQVSVGEELTCSSLESHEHTTKPPGRYSEATLVKTLEAHGIGRPSTYAPTISTIITRGYARREERKLIPTEMAELVTDLLVKHFPDVVDTQFTAHMEDELDMIAQGKAEWVPLIKDFYNPFKERLRVKEEEVTREDVFHEETEEMCASCGKPMIVKLGRFGKFLACSGFPECKTTKQLEPTSLGESTDGSPAVVPDPCDRCNAPMQMKRGRFGVFFGCSRYPECTFIRSLHEKKLDTVCPECHEGTLRQKRSKRGKTFYTCSRHPECPYISWTKPDGEEKEKSKNSEG